MTVKEQLQLWRSASHCWRVGPLLSSWPSARSAAQCCKGSQEGDHEVAKNCMEDHHLIRCRKPLLDVSAPQTSRSAAQAKQEEAKQMSANAAAMLVTINRRASADTVWQLTRPLLRLLLWLIPAHIPLRGVHPPALMQQPAELSLAGATPGASWQAELGPAYVADVATVSVQIDSPECSCSQQPFLS
jgi:hypothetical protein